ncbi:MAG TPA: glycosyltransferase, partial [Dehalococcoidia bacterium]|nr:glycosyltransferase [Dehalococcoidia bacterium]
GHRDDARALIAASDLFVLPSLFEGLPLVVLEAMAAGFPVVATRVCGTSEAVEDGVTGRLVTPEDPQALADGILEALCQPERAAQWGRAGRLRVEQEFRPARMAQETTAIYAEVL